MHENKCTVKIIRRVSYTFCISVLLFCTVAIYLLDLLIIFQAKLHDSSLPPHTNREVLAQLWSSDKRNGLHIVFFILNCSHWHAREAHSGLYQLGMTFVWVLISNCSAGITLMLHGYGYTRLYFWRRSSIWNLTALRYLCSTSKEVAIYS